MLDTGAAAAYGLDQGRDVRLPGVQHERDGESLFERGERKKGLQARPRAGSGGNIALSWGAEPRWLTITAATRFA